MLNTFYKFSVTRSLKRFRIFRLYFGCCNSGNYCFPIVFCFNSITAIPKFISSQKKLPLVLKRNKSCESAADKENIPNDDVPELFPYKDLKIHCKLLHAFDVVEQAFSMKEEKIDSIFYDGQLRINKQRIGKRYAKVRVGDVIDLILNVNETEVSMMRVELLSVNDEKSASGKWIMKVRRWKYLRLPRILKTDATAEKP